LHLAWSSLQPEPPGFGDAEEQRNAHKISINPCATSAK
jgi:hypothetical protein